MSSVNSRWARRRPGRVRTLVAATTDRGRELRWGIAGIVVVLILVAAVGVINLVGTTSHRTYTAELGEAVAVRTGDDVRVAGIPVGKVESLDLLPDRVRMTFTVEDGVFLGDQTTLAVRMLTLVGGYYVAVEPAGTAPLGETAIPPQRVILPYSLTQTFEDAIAPVRQTDGETIRRNLAVLSTSIDKSPDSVRNAVTAVGDIVSIMDKQNADISHTLSLSDEYLSALNQNSDVAAQLMNTFGTLEILVKNNRDSLDWALHGLAKLVHQFTPLGRIWDDSLKAQAQPLIDAIPKLQELGTRMNGLLESVRGFEQRLTPFVAPGGGITVDQSAATISGFCVPVPGGGC